MRLALGTRVGIANQLVYQQQHVVGPSQTQEKGGCVVYQKAIADPLK